MLISQMILARVLDLHDYATYRQALLIYSVAAPLLMLGLPSAIFYFMPLANDRSRTLLVENLTVLTSMGVLLAILFVAGGNRLVAQQFNNKDLVSVLLIMAPYAIFMFPITAVNSCLVVQDWIKEIAIYNVLSRLVMLSLTVAAGYMWRSAEAAIAATVVGAAIMVGPAFILMLKACKGGRSKPNWNGMLAQVKYGLPIAVASLSGIVSGVLDKFVVSSMCSIEDFAVYVNGALEIPLIGVITGSVTAVLIPSYVKCYKNQEYPKMIALWKSAMIKCSIIIFPLFVILFLTAPEFMVVLFSSKYAASANVFRVYLLLLPFRIVSYYAVMQAVGKTSWILIWELAGLAVNIALNVLLVHAFGYMGAAISTAIVSILSFIVILLAFSSIFKTSMREYMPFDRLFKVALCSLAAVPILSLKWLLPNSPLIRLIILYPASFIACIYAFSKMNMVDYRELISGLKLKRILNVLPFCRAEV
jgi:O-antigen/teichoic acid export membrane protein